MTRYIAGALAVTIITCLSPAANATDAPLMAVDADTVEPSAPSYAPSRMGIEAGLRTSVLEHPGFDPYSDDNLMAQFAFALRAVPLHVNFPGGHFGIALGGEYDVGASSASARGAASELLMHRLAGGAELYVDWWRLRMFVRGMPAAIHLSAQLADAGAPDELEAHAWTWGMDVTGGLRFRLGTVGTERDPRARFWLLVEAGYTFAGEAEMSFAPAEVDDSARVGSVTLPSLQPDGFVNRLGVGVSF